MKKFIRYIVTLGVIISITTFSSIITMADTNNSIFSDSGVEIRPNAAASKHVFKKISKSKSTSYGTATVECKFSGNYTYDLSSGEILSVYGGGLEYFTFFPPSASKDAPNPDFWEYEALNTRLSQSVINNGGGAKYTLSFTLKATYLEGGIIATNKTISIPVSDTIYVKAH